MCIWNTKVDFLIYANPSIFKVSECRFFTDIIKQGSQIDVILLYYFPREKTKCCWSKKPLHCLGPKDKVCSIFLPWNEMMGEVQIIISTELSQCICWNVLLQYCCKVNFKQKLKKIAVSSNESQVLFCISCL